MGVIFINPYRFAGFDPLSLSPALWLDASDTSTITASSGAVSQWNDKSGNGRHVSQATGTNQPFTGSATQNGLNVLSFFGDDYMTHDAGSDNIDLSPLTFAVVTYDANSTQTSSTFRRVVTTRRSAAITADYQSPNFAIAKNNTTRQIGALGNGIASPNVNYTNNAAFLLIGKMTSSAASVSINGSSFTSTSGNASIADQRYVRIAATCLGGGNPPNLLPSEVWVGRMMEIILVPADLSTSDVDALTSYLNAKWAIY